MPFLASIEQVTNHQKGNQLCFFAYLGSIDQKSYKSDVHCKNIITNAREITTSNGIW
jgi:hypothetical protein